jgi:uncharacterized membrane protein YeaQ/YmgE (transglycosylase-associated protein family)
MIGMNFSEFLVLLVASLVVAFVLHYLVRYRYLKGFDGFLMQWVVGWFGAWLGPPVLGHWWFHVESVYGNSGIAGSFYRRFLCNHRGKSLRTTVSAPANGDTLNPEMG